MIDMFLYDDSEKANIRFVSFIGDTRHDLTLIQTDRHYGKTIVLNTQSNKFGIIGRDDLDEDGYIAYVLGLSEAEAEEVTDFLREVIA
ncbi:DUF3055 domain-containing protein [Macrococcus equipercicus]|uniref:DUF3055 domain-containing protein n=1 Tax=Macrococcus equipercicus TaxID=69967 RepID=A0A9Q9BU02_9STAP|nr:DUF3055 domain-containing protein [Macrococcus equipercicus]KAA1042533.1 DUF3055 domain-containing protein [Macrococcus equipercicus]UTH14394.1 DUF3055 domain-containing protein [Macrococcus equipercicus]